MADQDELMNSGEESTTSFQETTDEVTGNVKETAERLTSEAKSMTGRMREGLVSSVNQQKDRATDELHHIAQAFRHTAQDLDEDGAAPYAKHIADYIDNASDYVKGQDVHGIMRAVDDFSHRHPILFFGAAAAVGILVARLLKSGGQSEEW